MVDAPNHKSNTFPTTAFPRLETMFRRGEKLWQERKDLQDAFPCMNSPEYWFWLLWYGPSEDLQIQESLYPLPDSFLRDRVVGELTPEEIFHQGGLVDWRRIEICFREGGLDFHPGTSILDFGCGCGRLIRHFGLYANDCNLYGADVDKDAVAWCAEKLDFCKFASLPHSPRTEFDNNSFDGIYAYSVFSHLPEDLHQGWLVELHRITRPGGILVITLQGQYIVDLVCSGERDLGCPSRKELQKSLQELNSKGFLFFPYKSLGSTDKRNAEHFAKWDLQQYGTTFVLESYVQKHWSEMFTIVAHHSAPDEWQDFVVLRRK